MNTSKTVWMINQYASTPGTGIGGRHYSLAKEMVAKGIKVYLIAASYTHIRRNSPLVHNDIQLQNVEGINFVWVNVPEYVDAHSKKRILNWFVFAWKLKLLKKVINDSPDAILCSSPSLVSFLGARWLSRKYSARLVFEVRDIWPLSFIELGGFSFNHPFIRFMQWIEDSAYHSADRVVSNLKYSVEHMVEWGMCRSKFTWIPSSRSLFSKYFSYG